VALGVFFPIYINTLHGVRSVDPHLIEMGRAYGMSRTVLIRRAGAGAGLPELQPDLSPTVTGHPP
jgi:sulfonate transport system permease protein